MATLSDLYPAYGIRPPQSGSNLGSLMALAQMVQGGGMSQEAPQQPSLASYGAPPAQARTGTLASLSGGAASPEDFTRWVMGQEGFRASPYGDYRQTSIGYGTRARPGETSITQAEAMTRLNDEIGNARSSVRRFMPNLSPAQENALTDLTFNAGADWMQSGLGSAVRAGNWSEAQRLFQQYVNAGGQPLDALRRRRQAAAPWLGMGY
jgi:GH24 family phage-related lysozyme (muramidase)